MATVQAFTELPQMYSTVTMLESSPAKDNIDSAVESACRLFLSTKTLLESNAGTVNMAEFGQSSDKFNTHMDFIETMVFTTSRLIRQMRDKQNGGHVDDSDYTSYVLAKTCAKYSMMVDDGGRYSCKWMMGLDVIPEAPKGMEHSQSVGWLPVGGGVDDPMATSIMKDMGDVPCKQVIEVSSTKRRMHEHLSTPDCPYANDINQCKVKMVWLGVYKSKFQSHELEEDYAFSRLLSGYDMPNLNLIGHYFRSFIDSKATFKKQMDSDKDIAKMELDKHIEYREDLITHIRGTHATQNLIHNILNMILQLKLAIDWKSKPMDSKTNYTNTYFEELNVDKIAAMRLRVSERDFGRWYSEEKTWFSECNEKYITARNWMLTLYEEFGSIVLLDPRWNPSKFGTESQSKSFVSFLVFLLANILMCQATSDELVGLGGMVKYNVGTRNDNDNLVLSLIKYITRQNDIVTYVKDFIKKTGKGKKTITVHGLMYAEVDDGWWFEGSYNDERNMVDVEGWTSCGTSWDATYWASSCCEVDVDMFIVWAYPKVLRGPVIIQYDLERATGWMAMLGFTVGGIGCGPDCQCQAVVCLVWSSLATCADDGIMWHDLATGKVLAQPWASERVGGPWDAFTKC
ncbi:hypothetical protein BDN71DRAFT_1436933 [Pleurotus eryngii]|uniref:Uncharacterized protein n=1 Tax=Pleurotus eryngii TaxID=5323 RepID=A0A9P5ZIP5_PLEER|nr:hypothetical protein BDN71DRAFT_1436933 [Pleurotus eryngii]